MEETGLVSGTIFDDVFRTMVERMPQLVIPLINEVFGTNYDGNEEIVPVHNEHQTKSGEVITDSCLMIRSKMYHIECQSRPDTVMAVRMIEYDFAIALNNVVQNEEVYEMEFPKSCTLYLRHTRNTPDELKVRVYFGNRTEDGRESIVYTTPVVKVQNYTKDEIFQKKLLLFLPFYIMRYENQFTEIRENSAKLEQFLTEYDNIREELEKVCSEKSEAELYTDLMELIIKISDYMLKSEEDLKKKVGGIMGGKVLKLRSEELREEGFEEGKAEGKAEGLAEGIRITKQVLLLSGEGRSVEMIALELGISSEEVNQILSE